MKAQSAAAQFLAPGSKIKLGFQIAAVVILGVVVYKLVKKSEEFFDDQSNREENQSTANELEQLNKNPSTRQKITNSQAQGYANSIYGSMQGLGTDEQAIKDIFYHLKNDADFLAVKKAFGTKTVWSGTPFFVGDFRGTFIPCLRNELSSYWIGAINKILRDKKIKYRV
jgi:hypothetical protein